MALGNDFRKAFRLIGNIEGDEETSKCYEEIGMIFSFVGNCCLHLIQKDTKHFVMCCADDESETKVGGTYVGGVVCDLWWFSLVDHDEYTRRFGHTPDEKDVDVIECAPGVYEFNFESDKRDDEIEVVCEIRWRSEPTELVDYLKKQRVKNYTAGQIVDWNMKKLQKIHDEFAEGILESRKQLVDCLEKIVEALRSRSENNTELAKLLELKERSLEEAKLELNKLTTQTTVYEVVDMILGSPESDHFQVHENGWLSSDGNLPDDLPDIQIPVLQEKYDWEELSDDSFLAIVAGLCKDDWFGVEPERVTLNESFTELAFNMLHAMLTVGWLNEKPRQRTIETTKKILFGIAKRYPDRIPEYCRELLLSLGYSA